jgi:dTDP-4-dehydrorhamnose reductase
MGSRVLVLGASGMLGHEVVRVLAGDHEVWGACRDPNGLPDLGVPRSRIIGGLDATSAESARSLLDRITPEVVVNAAGIVKQRREASDAVQQIQVNALWPHRVADACSAIGARLIQISTDCVFSGDRGGYTEEDIPDERGLYGRSKLLGEIVDRDDAITLRTSIIGWQLGTPTGLIGWFAAHRREALDGYTRAVFSGVTTSVLAEAIRDRVLDDATLYGLWHVSAEPIDKFTLLTRLADKHGWTVDVRPVPTPVIDRSLNSNRFRSRTGWSPPTWDAMLAELAASPDAPE